MNMRALVALVGIFFMAFGMQQPGRRPTVFVNYERESKTPPPAKITGRTAGIQLVEEYEPEKRSYFELLGGDIKRLIRDYSEPTIEDAGRFIRNVYGSSKDLKLKLSDPAFTDTTLQELSQRYLGAINPETMARAAIALNTDDSREYLAKQTDFMLEAIRKSRNPIYAEYARAIIESGAPVNIRDARGDTPLMLAIDPDKIRNLNPPLNIELASLLLDKGAETKIKRPDGVTVLDLAEKAVKAIEQQSFSTAAGKSKSSAFQHLAHRIASSEI